jgi:hypothetical protein
MLETDLPSSLPPWLRKQRGVLHAVNQFEKIPAGPKLAYNTLVEIAGEAGCCWHNNKFLGRSFAVHPDTAKRWLGVLEDQRLIACRWMPPGAELPGQNGKVVEAEEGTRLIVVLAIWGDQRLPFHPLDRRPPGERRTSRKGITILPPGSPKPSRIIAPVLPRRANRSSENKKNANNGDDTNLGSFAMWGELSADRRELFGERAAIMEYDGGLSREAAEFEAQRAILVASS